MKSLSVIFPALNEQANIRRTVDTAIAVLPNLVAKWEIIVINDGSMDETGRICDELVAEHPDVVAVHHPENRGYGAALKTGILQAKHDLIFFTDADAQFDLAELRTLLEFIDHYDIVAGYRAKRKDPPYRLLNAWGWNMLVKIVLGIRIRDIDCAFKVFRREVFEQINIRSVGAMVNTEILAQVKRFGMSVKEVPVTHYPRVAGNPTGANLRVIAKAFYELGRVWWKVHRLAPGQPGLFGDPAHHGTPPAHRGAHP